MDLNGLISGVQRSKGDEDKFLEFSLILQLDPVVKELDSQFAQALLEFGLRVILVGKSLPQKPSNI